MTGGLEERKEVLMGGIDRQDTRGQHLLKKGCRESAVEFGEELTLHC